VRHGAGRESKWRSQGLSLAESLAICDGPSWQARSVAQSSKVKTKTCKRRAMIRRQLHSLDACFSSQQHPLSRTHSPTNDPSPPSRAEINVRRSRPRHPAPGAPLSSPSETAWTEAWTGQGRSGSTSRAPRDATRNARAVFSLRRGATVHQRRLSSLPRSLVPPYPPLAQEPLPPIVVARSPQARTRPAQL
jgi:hypothetical protein